jgi:hypothetical protein
MPGNSGLKKDLFALPSAACPHTAPSGTRGKLALQAEMGLTVDHMFHFSAKHPARGSLTNVRKTHEFESTDRTFLNQYVFSRLIGKQPAILSETLKHEPTLASSWLQKIGPYLNAIQCLLISHIEEIVDVKQLAS